MVGVAIGLLWLSYYGGLYGYCLIRGYDVTPKELLSPSWPQYGPSDGGSSESGPKGGSGFGPGAGSGGGAGGGGGSSF